MARLTYKELSKKQIKPQRNIVVSEAYDKDDELFGYSIAEQLVTYEGDKEIKMFLKNGLGILDIVGLINLRNAIDEAVKKIDKK